MRKYLFLLLRLSGIPLLLRILLQKDKVTVLCYHDPSPDVMDAHLRILKSRYNIIPLWQYIEWRIGKSVERIPPYAMVITLDDGHRNNALLRPVLQQSGTPLTVFLCSAIVGTHRHYWWTRVSTAADREALKRLPDEERRARLARWQHTDTTEYSDRQALSRQEIEELRPLVDFQSHTRFHPVLPECQTQRAADEIAGSKTDLEQLYGLPIYAIAYPNGDYSRRDVELAKAAGYTCALTIDGGYNTTDTDLFRLQRIPVDDQADANELIVKASGFWDMIQTALGRRRYGCRPSRAEQTTERP